MKNLARTCLAAAFLLALSASAALAAQPVRSRAHASHPSRSPSRASSATSGWPPATRPPPSSAPPNALTFGGAVRVTLWRGAFVSIGVRTFAKDGERVFVATPGSPVQKLGHPAVDADDAPAAVGRLPLPERQADRPLPLGRRRGHRLSRAQRGRRRAVRRRPDEGGLRRRRGRRDRPRPASASAPRSATRPCPSTIGIAGVSKVYGETDAGGFHAIGKVILAFGI